MAGPKSGCKQEKSRHRLRSLVQGDGLPPALSIAGTPVGLAPIRSRMRYNGGENRIISPSERSGAGVMMRA
jgi:hypothetical protein